MGDVPNDTAAATRSTRSAAFLTACVVGQSVAQFGFQLVLAALYGAGPEMDAFVAAWTVPMVVGSVLAGAIGFAFVPAHAKVLVDGDSGSESRLIGETLLLVITATGLVAILLATFAGTFVAWLVPGFDAERTSRTIGLLRGLAWLVPLHSLAALLRAIQQGRGRFAITGVAALVGSIVLVAVTGLRGEVDGIGAVVAASLAGAAATCVLLAPGAIGRPRFEFGLDPSVRGFLVMLAPLVLGAILQSSGYFVDRHLASRMVEGTVARLGYASQLIGAVLVVGVRGLSTVAFPNFARLAAAGDDDGLRTAVAGTARGVVFVFVPIAAGLGCFARPAVRTFLERNAFDAGDTAVVSALLVAYLGVLVFGAVGDVLAKLLYAWRRAWFLVAIGGGGLVLGTLAKVLFAPNFGVVALAWCSSAVSLATAIVLVACVHARLGRGAFAGTGTALARALTTTAPALAIAWFLVPTAAGVLLAAPAAGVTYLALNIALGDPLARQLVGR